MRKLIKMAVKVGPFVYPYVRKWWKNRKQKR
ncbi:hypothetical protein SAMN05421781_1453 [Marinococcus luteus]|uniref:Uncharacterized protein n=1 Tax=Marinococcus luteus TaxID=1122204 RepID=A0A1H2TKV3_9BACI|nr:hypothetical protein SAMN05421781_1453 [Marinococcus luteus]